MQENIILGVDEVGRGPLAGPVVAAAVVLIDDHEKLEIRDSKSLSENKIIKIADQIKKCAHYAIEIASVEEIENINILQATMLAMRRAISKIKHPYTLIKVDGDSNPLKNDATPTIVAKCITLTKGDSICRSIAAASIIAKAYRDDLMRQFHKEYPHYNWNKNKGYGTKEHTSAIIKHGLSPMHRPSFCKRYV